MQEIPALAPVIAAFSLLLVRKRQPIFDMLAGILFSTALDKIYWNHLFAGDGFDHLGAKPPTDGSTSVGVQQIRIGARKIVLGNVIFSDKILAILDLFFDRPAPRFCWSQYHSWAGGISRATRTILGGPF